MKTVLLGDVAEVQGGGTPPTTRSELFGGSLQWFTPTEIVAGKISFLVDSVRTLTDQGAMFTAVADPGTVLLTSRAGIGKVGILETRAGFNQGIKGITPDPGKLDSMYLAYWLIANKDLLEERASGTTFTEISTSNVKKLEIPCPDIKEQKRIVKKLEKAFAAIDKAKQNTEKNLQNSKDLFSSKLINTFFEATKNYPSRSLVDVCLELYAGGDVPKNGHSKEMSEKYSVPIYSNGVKGKGLYGYTNLARTKKPSVTISARGTIGHSELRMSPFFPVVRLIVLTPNTKMLNVNYLYFAIRSMAFSNTGTSIPQLTVPMVKDRKIPLPPIPAQIEIVIVLEGSLDNSKKLQELYRKKLTTLEELRQSILKQAFEGKL